MKVALPWVGCLLLLGGSAAFDAGAHAYSQFFQCPAYDKGTLVARPLLPLQMKMILTGLESGTPKTQMGYIGQSLAKNRFVLTSSSEAGWIFDRPGKTKDEGVIVGTSLKNLPTIATLLSAAGEMRTLELNRTIRIAILQEDAVAFPEILAGFKAVRAVVELGSLTQFSEEGDSQSYAHWTGNFYPSRGNFLAFVSGNQGKSLTHVSSSYFHRYSHTKAECFKTVGWVPSAIEPTPSAIKALGLPYVLVSDTGDQRKSTSKSIDLEQLSDTTVGIAKILEGFALDPNPAQPIPKPLS